MTRQINPFPITADIGPDYFCDHIPEFAWFHRDLLIVVPMWNSMSKIQFERKSQHITKCNLQNMSFKILC